MEAQHMIKNKVSRKDAKTAKVNRFVFLAIFAPLREIILPV
jgi:hypothetical protein